MENGRNAFLGPFGDLSVSSVCGTQYHLWARVCELWNALVCLTAMRCTDPPGIIAPSPASLEANRADLF